MMIDLGPSQGARLHAFAFRLHQSKVHQLLMHLSDWIGSQVANQLRVRREERQTCSRPSFPANALHCAAHCTMHALDP
jgi:hypothetical protein